MSRDNMRVDEAQLLTTLYSIHGYILGILNVEGDVPREAVESIATSIDDSLDVYWDHVDAGSDTNVLA